MRYRILIVDDSAMMRQFVTASLSAVSGLSCDQACDGMQALKMLAADRYDILITDINMPQIDGLKLLELVRKDPQYCNLPVVVVTTEGAELTREAALAAGADEYLTKPLQTGQVVRAVRKMLDPENRRH